MQILAAFVSFALLLQQGFAAPDPQKSYGKPPARPPPCPADKCFASIRLVKPVAKIASAVCSKYIKYTPAVTRKTTTVTTTTIISMSTVNESQVPITATSFTTITPPAVTESPTCTSTVETVTEQGVFSTVVNFRRRGEDPPERKRDLEERDVEERALPLVPAVLGANCGSGKAYTSRISSACSCLLGKTKTSTSVTTSTVSVTSVVTNTNTISAETSTITSIVTDPTPTSTDCQTSTSVTTTTTFAAGDPTCGVPVRAYASGSVVCPNVAPPQQTNARFRIEGGSEGNVFEGCIASGPANITTPSGGTHKCDGTNNNANPSPGGTLITQIDAAGRQEGFGFDGTYSNQFADFFINSISQTTSTGNQFWGVLRNLVFTSRGGCQEPNFNGDEGLWAFDAFAPNRVFLKLDPEYQVVAPGTTGSITLTVTQANPNNGNLSPAAGASIGTGSPSDSNGNIQLTVPTTPGCYQYKAEKSNAIRSNTFYLTVIDGLE